MVAELWLQPQTLAFTQVYIRSSNFCTSVQYWIQGKYHHKEAIPLLSNHYCLWSSTCTWLVCFKASNQNIQSIGTLNRKLVHTWLIVESLIFLKSTKRFHYLTSLLFFYFNFISINKNLTIKNKINLLRYFSYKTAFY